MEKHEIFNKATGRFKDRSNEDLLSIGISIGSNHATFRNLYTAYITNKAKYENTPRIGAKLKVEFNRSEDEVLIKRATTELKFNTREFMDYLNLVSICFGEIYPLGSVVELDNKLLTKEYKNSSRFKEEERSWAIIVSRFVSPNENDQHFIEYIATPYPHGEGTMFLNRLTIRGVVHSGLTDETAEAYVQQLRENLVVSNKKSMAFLTDEELDELFKQPTDMNRNMVYGEVC